MGIHVHLGPNRSHRRTHHTRTTHHKTSGGSIPLTPKNGFLISLFLLVIGIGCLFLYNHQNNLQKNYITTTGVVYEIEERYDSDDGYMYSSTIEYVVGGEKYYIDSNSWSSVPDRLGKSVKVKYNPDKPSQAIIAGVKGSSWVPLVVGIIFTGCGVLLLGKTVTLIGKGKKSNDDEKIEIE